MVALGLRKTEPITQQENAEVLLRWCSVNLSEVVERGKRLEASVFDIDGKHARNILEQCKWGKPALSGEHGLADAYHRLRFKRIWVEKSDFPIYQPSQIIEIAPKPSGYLSSLTKTNIDNLRVIKGQVLLTCSGTIGDATYVSLTLDNKIFSHDLIRITAKNKTDSGFIYAYIKSKIGNTIIKTNQYGAVVSHIEPEHLSNVPIPNPPDFIKKIIHGLIVKSFQLRDESNELINQAEKLFHQELNLPPIEELKPKYFNDKIDIRNYTVNLSKLNNRFDGSYHVPVVEVILERFKKKSAEVTTIADPRISRDITLPGRFKRVYVEEGQGTVFFGGKQLFELVPSAEKYLSLMQHGERIRNELILKENMVLVTRSGTVGKTVLVPKHWEQWVANEHVIRIIPSGKDIAGYLSVFLATEYGQELICRNTFGSVVDEIDTQNIADIIIPILQDQSVQTKINNLALEANSKRTEAYNLEREAIEKMNELVIYAKK